MVKTSYLNCQRTLYYRLRDVVLHKSSELTMGCSKGEGLSKHVGGSKGYKITLADPFSPNQFGIIIH